MATKKKLPYVIIRAEQAGCFAGELASRKELPSGTSVGLQNARRLWYWSGAASLSQLALDGVCDPRNCKFPPAVKTQEIMGVIEIISTTEKCRKSIAEVPEWRA